MSLEKYREIVAIPRMHEEFTENGNAMTLDPTGQNILQNHKAYAAKPAFCWNTHYALQYLKDLQENTAQLAKEKNTSLLDRLGFAAQNTQGLTKEEEEALQAFSGEKSEQNQENMLLERAQRMLLIAWYNESLYLELAAVNKNLAKQQEKLKSLLDENEHVKQNSYQTDDVLLSWKQVLPAFMPYTQDVSAYFVNDAAMAEDIAALAKEKTEEDQYFCYAVEKNVLGRFMGKEFAACCKKDVYYFLVTKQPREVNDE